MVCLSGAAINGSRSKNVQEGVEVARLLPHEQVHQRIVEKVVDVPMPQILKFQLMSQEQSSTNRVVEVCGRVCGGGEVDAASTRATRTVDQIVDVPVSQMQDSVEGMSAAFPVLQVVKRRRPGGSLGTRRRSKRRRASATDVPGDRGGVKKMLLTQARMVHWKRRAAKQSKLCYEGRPLKRGQTRTYM